MKKRLCTGRIFLTAILILSLLAPSMPTATAETVYTNLQAAEKIAAACDDYAAPVPTILEILGEWNADDALTHLSCAEMLYRGFGELPAPTGFRSIVGYRETAFTDVPKDKEIYVKNLTDAMICIPENNEYFEPNAAMSEAALLQLLGRLYAYLGTNLKDDYFTAVNSAALTVPLDESVYDPRGSWFFIYEGNDSFYTWVRELLAESENSDKAYMQNIAAFYSTYISREARERGTARIKGYMDEILSAQNAEELLPVIEKIGSETGEVLLLPEWSFTNRAGSAEGTYIGYIYTPSVYSDRLEDYLPDGEYYTYCSDWIYCLTQALVLVGYTEEESRALVDGQFCSDGNLAVLLSGEDTGESPSYDLTAYLNLCGYPLKDGQYKIDPRYLNASLSLLYSPDTFKAYQASCAVSLLLYATDYMAPRIHDWLSGYWISYYDADLSLYLEDGNLGYYLLPILTRDISEAFYDTFDVKTEADKLDALFMQCKGEFAEMLGEDTWLSDETREKALKKLDAMQIHIGAGDDINNKARAQYVSAADGGSMYDNYCLMRKASNENSCRYLGRDINDLTVMTNMIMPLEDNCYYASYCNGVYISIPFLYRDFMCADSREEYYANVKTLGHEITHGFDTNGCQFNAQGKRETWWQKEDMERFEALCAQVTELYQKTEFAPGLSCNSESNISENVADMGGLRIVLGLLENETDFDYARFFEYLAQKEVAFATRTGFAEKLYGDSHAVNRARINPLLSLTDKFYEVYGITEQDSMYVSPEERVRVW